MVEHGRPGWTRRQVVRGGIAGVATLAGGSYGLARLLRSDPDPRARPGGTRDRLSAFAENVTSGGPPKDGIPPIDEPHFVSATEARFLSDDDVVFGLERDGDVRAYPQLVLVWHEIVNDSFPSGRLSITYCPLTGSVVAFRGRAPDSEPYTFGTSGKLVNSNLLMYDRQTDSRWPQILGQSILGPSRGRRLEEVTLDWTTWGRWRGAYPRTRVLSTNTGHLRAYGDDPYGSYTPLGGYYRDASLFFPVMHRDERLESKDVVIGIKLGRRRLAVRKELLRQRVVVGRRLGDQPIVLLYDAALDAARAYLASARRRELDLEPADRAGEFVDATGSTWETSGRAVDGPLAGERLRPVVSYDVMWFAWAAFYPETELEA